jgi:murein L,D-transpeptidase YafK
MVHGVCSSAGCFSMTDEQINDIYAIARDAFRGGQREIQLQSYPFRMTAENLAKYRLDPNIDFWMEIKNGSNHFEVTKTEPSVIVCNKHYVSVRRRMKRFLRWSAAPRSTTTTMSKLPWPRRKARTRRRWRSSLPPA